MVHDKKEITRLTPAMRQFYEIKKKYPDCILLFRMGDFYETFYDDAIITSKVLNITLTSRGKGDKKAPLAGIPYHALNQYLAKLVKAGHKVAIVEQLEDPKKAKGIVKRGVVRVITPGTIVEDFILDGKSNNYIACVVISKDNEDTEKMDFGLSISDISTGEFLVSSITGLAKLINELVKFGPSEIIMPRSYKETKVYKSLKDEGFYVELDDDKDFWLMNAISTIKEHFETEYLEGFGFKNEAETIAAGALLAYLAKTQKIVMKNITTIKHHNIEDYMIIDKVTIRNLELLKNIYTNEVKHSLLWVVDRCVTAMGSRLLKRWLIEPLIDVKAINKRLNAVEILIEDFITREKIRDELSKIYDIERLVTKANYRQLNPKETLAIKRSIDKALAILELCKEFNNDLIRVNLTREERNSLVSLSSLINKMIVDDPPSQVNEGGFIKQGYNSKLDELRNLAKNTKEMLAKIEAKERARTGISSLKLGYNKVFGYYIEVSNTHKDKVPKDYIRKQTLVNAERYITPQLKELESTIIHAQESYIMLEQQLFDELVNKIIDKVKVLQKLAQELARIDVIISFSKVSEDNNYTKPIIVESDEIILRENRHPVVEQLVDEFIANDIHMNGKDKTIMIITGPNMAGKSTILRQVALTIIMAQMGCFVPASYAKIGVVDRVFSRVGASDNIAYGQSTFMVEMIETANILNNATNRSFIILDEIGRGTSTYDGVALATAIIEYIAENIKAKTMFATHYHQLNKLSERFNNVKNYNVAVSETSNGIIFLRKLLPGGTDKSYGIEVAKLAGLPKQVIERAREIMKHFEMEDIIAKRLETERSLIIDKIKNNIKNIKNNKKEHKDYNNKDKIKSDYSMEYDNGDRSTKKENKESLLKWL